MEPIQRLIQMLQISYATSPDLSGAAPQVWKHLHSTVYETLVADGYLEEINLGKGRLTRQFIYTQKTLDLAPDLLMLAAL